MKGFECAPESERANLIREGTDNWKSKALDKSFSLNKNQNNLQQKFIKRITETAERRFNKSIWGSVEGGGSTIYFYSSTFEKKFSAKDA